MSSGHPPAAASSGGIATKAPPPISLYAAHQRSNSDGSLSGSGMGSAFSSRGPSAINRATRSSASIDFCGRAAALAFATGNDVEPPASKHSASVDSEPTFLFLTQNIGGIDAAAQVLPGGEPEVVSLSTPIDLKACDDGDAFQSFSVAPDGDGVMEQTKVKASEFIADLRAWIHRMAVLTERRKKHRHHQQQQQQATTHAKDSEQKEDGLRAGEDAAPSLAGYSPTDTPPQMDVVVVHLQEVGGKHMNRRFNAYLASELKKRLLPEAGWTSGLLMDMDGGCSADFAASPDTPTPSATLDFNTGSQPETNFTALGSILFLSPRMARVSSMLSFPHRTYIPIPDDPCSYGGSDKNVFKTAKFSTAGRSRKGYLLTSLRLGTCVLNTCNVHLFNDEDNVEALQRSPSKYVSRRTDALLEMFAESLAVVDREEPFFVCGDTNMRLDGKQLADHLRATYKMELRPAKKALRCPESFWPLFSAATGDQQRLRQRFDKEPLHAMEIVAQQTGMELAELPVRFAPTYSRVPTSLTDRIAARKDTAGGTPGLLGRSADNKDSTTTGDGVAAVTLDFPSAAALADGCRGNFAHERIPAWCDRVFFNPAGLELIAGGRFDHHSSASGHQLSRDKAGNEEEEEEKIGEGEAATLQNGSDGRHYLYDAVSLLHTDHDGVFLSF